MKRILVFAFAMTLSMISRAQNDNAAGSILLSPIALTNATSLAASGCEATVRNLGATTSPQTVAGAWTMSNDCWFHFVAFAEVAKIKVCSPTTFDAAIEVWNAGATGTAIASSNVGGSGAKEYLCVSGLTIGSTYKVRVGRVSGSGAGTFNISYEHLGVELRIGYYPDPPGAATCYDFTTSIQRSLISYGVGATRWKFVDEAGTVFGPYTLTYSITLSQCPGICEGHTYAVSCEVQANDPECGNIWWGYSTPRSIVTCASSCPVLTYNSGTGLCGSTFCNIFNTDFQATYMGVGFEYQFKFVTDNGNTEFCSPWTTTPIFSSSTYAAFFRYNKIYQVYVRARKCNQDPPWCGPCTFNSCNFPYVSVASTQCCKWRNKSNGGLISTPGIDQVNSYRFRFTPISINPCLPNPLTPQGPAVTTGWTGNGTNPAGLALILGTVYSVQVQARVLASTVTQCNGTSVSIPGQQSDWGPVCLIGIRSASSPAVGTALGCYCLPGMEMEEEVLMDEQYRDYIEYEVTEQPAIVMSVMDQGVVLNTMDAGLVGDGIMRVYNMSGQLVMSRNLYAMESNSYLEIETASLLPMGVYIISIQSDSTFVSERVFLRGE